MTKKIKQVMAIAILALLIQGCCGTSKIVCPDGETVVIQKCPEKQYQQTINTTDVGLKATVDVLDKVKIADLDASVKTKVTELRDKLDQFSSRTQDIIKGSYDALQTTPCDKDVRKRHFDLLDGIAKENAALEKLRTELSNLANKGNFGGVDENKVKALIEQYNSSNGEKAFTK